MLEALGVPRDGGCRNSGEVKRLAGMAGAQRFHFTVNAAGRGPARAVDSVLCPGRRGELSSEPSHQHQVQPVTMLLPGSIVGTRVLLLFITAQL